MSAKVLPFRPPERTPEELGDEALVAACAVGDRTALAVLFRRHHASLYRFFGRLVGHAGDLPDDLVQSTFLVAWDQASRFRARSSVRVWLMGIAANLARRHHRSQKRRRRALERLGRTPTAGPRAVDQQVEDRVLVDRLAEALADLPHDLRVVYVMCEIEEAAGTDVAAALGVRPGTVWRRLHDARKRLRKALKGDEP